MALGVIVIDSEAITFIRSFVKVGHLIHKLKTVDCEWQILQYG